MSELRLPWHAGRTTGRALYDGEGPDDLIGVMDTRELAAVVVAAVNARQAAVRGAQAQETASDARWRALVGEIVACARPYLGAWEALATVEAERGEPEALAHRWLAAIRQAQVALDEHDAV